MKQTISVYAFRDAFHAMDRGDQFSYSALGAIFDHLEEAEEAAGEELELDVIAICCDFTEHDSARDAATEYDWTVPNIEEGEELDDYAERAEADARSWLEERTTVLDAGDSIVIQNF